MECSINMDYILLVGSVFSSIISVLVVLSVVERGILKSPLITVELSTSFTCFIFT